MMPTQKKWIIVITACILLILTITLPALDFRNISAAKLNYYFYGGYKWRLEDAFITRINTAVSFALKALHEELGLLELQQSTPWKNTQGCVEVVVNFGPVYSAFSYNLGYTSEEIFTHKIYMDATHETATFLISPALEMQFNSDHLFIKPALFGSYYGIDPAGIKGRISLIYAWQQSLDGSLWIEGKYRVFQPLDVRVGGAVSSLYYENNTELKLEYAVLSGLDWRITDKAAVKYNFAFIVRPSSYQMISQEIVVDVKF